MTKNDKTSDSSVDSRKKESEQVLQEIFEKNPHLMSSGARTEVRKIKAGFVVLAIATIVGIWAFTNRADRNLRHEINSLGRNNCIGSIATFQKYNDLVNAILITRRQALKVAIKEHNKQQIKLNKAALERYSKDKLTLPTMQQCNKPIINP